MEPKFLHPVDVEHIARIDGAVLVDGRARCHAFGVILDGVATGHGSRARGARFNSAVRYQRSSAPECVSVVISDDGSVDLIPLLRPRIDREVIAEVVDRLVNAGGEQARDSTDRFGDALRDVERFSFYFNIEQCIRVNEAEMKWRLHSGGVSISQPPIEPDPDMNERFWL